MNAPDDRTLSEPPLWLTVAIIVAATVAAFHDVAGSVVTSPDVWSYLELSNTVFDDFYHRNTARAFESDDEYSLAFPPLWPILIAVVRRVHDFGVLTGVILNAGVVVALAGVMILLVRRFGLPGWVGTAAFLTLMSVNRFNDEVQSGRSIPLTVLLLMGTFAALAHAGRWTAPVAGLLMGLAALTRYDAAPVAAVVGLGILVLAWRRTRRIGGVAEAAVTYAGILLLTISPWIMYCQAHFGRPFASDNVRQLVRAEGGHVTEYFDTPPPNDLRDRPGKWLAGLALVKAPRILLAFIGGIKNSAAPLIFAAVAVVAAARGKPPLPIGLKRWFVYGTAVAAATGLGSLLVGYGEARYFSPAYAVLAVVLNGLLAAWVTGWTHGRASVYLIVLLVFPVYRLADQWYTNRRDNIEEYRPAIPRGPTPEMNAVTEAVRRDSQGRAHRVLITPAWLAAAYGALTGEPTTFLPNLDHGTLRHFAKNWRVTHAYDTHGMLSTVDTTGVRLIPLDVPYLYRIELDP